MWLLGIVPLEWVLSELTLNPVSLCQSPQNASVSHSLLKSKTSQAAACCLGDLPQPVSHATHGLFAESPSLLRPADAESATSRRTRKLSQTLTRHDRTRRESHSLPTSPGRTVCHLPPDAQALPDTTGRRGSQRTLTAARTRHDGDSHGLRRATTRLSRSLTRIRRKPGELTRARRASFDETRRDTQRRGWRFCKAFSHWLASVCKPQPACTGTLAERERPLGGVGGVARLFCTGLLLYSLNRLVRARARSGKAPGRSWRYICMCAACKGCTLETHALRLSSDYSADFFWLIISCL